MESVKIYIVDDPNVFKIKDSNVVVVVMGIRHLLSAAVL